MDFFIPSVLFGIALLAVILLVVLVSSEARAQRQRAARPKPATVENHLEISSEIEGSASETESKPPEKVLEIEGKPPEKVLETESEPPEKALPTIVATPPISAVSQWSPLLHDQIQDLSLELRSVYQEVHAIEQKLGVLTTKIEHLERMRDGHAQIEEEQETLQIIETTEELMEKYPTQSS